MSGTTSFSGEVYTASVDRNLSGPCFRGVAPALFHNGHKRYKPQTVVKGFVVDFTTLPTYDSGKKE